MITLRAAATLGAAAGLLAAYCALAQPAPVRTRPTRDVAVTYTVTGAATTLVPGGLPGPVTLSWDAAGQRLRAEAAGQSQVALLDLRGGAAQAFDTGLRVSIPLPLRPDDLQPLTLDGVRLTARTQDTVAGLSCTTYAFESRHGPGSVCLTADGVPLRGEGMIKGKPGRFAATAVRYGALPPDLFDVPPGYISLGQMGGQGGGKGGKLPNLRDLLGGLR